MSQSGAGLPFDGIILTDKAEGESSYDVVRRFKRHFGIKKVGHAGTLDPFATGLLIILLGQGTKLSPYLMAGRKRYSATMEMGIETDTLDPTGRIVNRKPVPDLNRDDILKVLQGFTGEIEQVPPAFSAVKYEGERAYKLARKGVDVSLKRRKVHIHSIELKSVDLPFITLDICCSAGTYIRSLAYDIGIKSGTVAHLKSLRRICSGSFSVESSVLSKEVETFEPKELFEKCIPLIDALPDLKEARLDSNMSEKVRNGCLPEWEELRKNASFPDMFEGSIKILDDLSLVAIMEIGHLSGNEKNWLRKIRVFN